jgi:hypothetical protein
MTVVPRSRTGLTFGRLGFESSKLLLDLVERFGEILGLAPELVELRGRAAGRRGILARL